MSESATIDRRPPTADRRPPTAEPSLWQKIWDNKGRDSDAESIIIGHTLQEIVLELKRLDGFDSVGSTLTFDAFHRQYTQIKNELSFGSISPHRISSVFEVGCGSGALLYLFQKDGVKTGGIDYSGHLVKIARGVLRECGELICGEAVNTPHDVKYDAVFSNSVFQYFTDLEYAERVMEIMYEKSLYSIGILDVHDLSRKEAFTEYRMRTVENYAEKYAGLDKLFIPKNFFITFAEKHNLNLRFANSVMPGYWNNPFIYNVFMTRE